MIFVLSLIETIIVSLEESQSAAMSFLNSDSCLVALLSQSKTCNINGYKLVSNRQYFCFQQNNEL
jgi:hypothetical protein